MKLARRVSAISPSKTFGIDSMVQDMRKKGMDVISFGIGEPDFDTPENVKAAGIEAIKQGYTKYTAAAGSIELREAICEKLKRENNLDYQPSQIVVSNGAKHSIYNIMQVLCEEGDEVIIPSPYWLSYPEQVRLMGGIPVFVKAGIEQGFKVTGEALAAAITKRTKIIILNSPCNPTGAVYTKKELEAIAEVAVKHGVYVISDEIYEHFVYDGAQHYSIASFGDEIKSLTLVVNGLSKSHAMTGWRIGYVAGDLEIIRAISNVQSHTTSNPVSISQKAAIAALRDPGVWTRQMVTEFKARRDFLLEKLRDIPDVECPVPDGAFYVFPKVSKLYGGRLGARQIKDSASFCEAVLNEARVALIPGSAFGDDECVRISYATSMNKLEEGIHRLKDALKRIRTGGDG
ncbi:MAG TPA: pyridoxal phosphate-dependent aminotransferase [Firmicutes bacterium]|nr:pyridoxal phosphate-dependent aminotransferase [Bacillota bacterium]